MKLQQLIEQYIEYRNAWNGPARIDGRHLLSFQRAIGGEVDIADIRPDQVDAFLAGDGPITTYWHAKHSTLRTFYRYAVSRGYVTAAPLPAVVPKRPSPFVPYIFSHEDLRALLQAVDSDQRSQTCLEPITMRTILLLLYGAGLRVREAINLNGADVDLENSVATIRDTKFGKTRLVPFGSPLGGELSRYSKRAPHVSADSPFFTTRAGNRVKPDTLHHNYRILCNRAGVRRSDGGRYQPRLHDLRHTFAVHRLTSWYRQEADVQKLLPLLSVYMGHVHLRATQVYLTMTPDLLGEACKRFECYVGKGGVA